MPRSRSIGLLSSTCCSISRAVRPPHSWMMRSASVDLPWSTWAMMEKLRMFRIGSDMEGCAMAVVAALRCKRRIIAWPGPSPSLLSAKGRGKAGRSLPGVLARGDRDERGGIPAPHQQHHRLARLDPGQGLVEFLDAAHRLGADPQHDHPRLQPRLACGQPF